MSDVYAAMFEMVMTQKVTVVSARKSGVVAASTPQMKTVRAATTVPATTRTRSRPAKA